MINLGGLYGVWGYSQQSQIHCDRNKSMQTDHSRPMQATNEEINSCMLKNKAWIEKRVAKAQA